MLVFGLRNVKNQSLRLDMFASVNSQCLLFHTKTPTSTLTLMRTYNMDVARIKIE